MIKQYFCLFWLKYVENNQSDQSFMTDNAISDTMRSWRGIAKGDLLAASPKKNSQNELF